ncbi:MAG TPA: glycosyltransferase family 9 protein [Vicinamibacterales bacterium]|jgi:ADP-heptose:LPS heptosyltransferase|nr:glycosyltransferase family 9 protein [Vicinamibacterales bacterium]
MRRIDFWAGIPLCFLVTAANRVLRAVGYRGRGHDRRPKQILFIQLAEMGTMVVAYPALRKTRELFPDATLHFLCFGQVRSSLEMLNVIDPANIHTIDSKSITGLLRDTLRTWSVARRAGIDTVVNLETFVRYSSLLSWLTGAARRVGFHRFNQEGLYTGDFLTHKVMYNAQIHTGHTFLDLVHALVAPPGGIPIVKRPKAGDDLGIPRLTTDASTAAAIWAKLAAINPLIDPSKKLIVLNPNASKRFPMRRLPLESYAELARQLLEEPDVFVIITGVADEKPDAVHICSHVGSPRVVDLTGQTTMMELLHLFNLAQVLVTNDSGPAHFACLTGIHVIVFFGPELPDRYRPLARSSDVVYTGYTCSPCVSPYNQRLSICNDNLCLKTIDIRSVSDLVRRRLRQPVTA